MQVAGAETSNQGVIRVMLVDDSAVVRGLFTRALEADSEIQVVASVNDGKMALNSLKRTSVDVILLDIDMPNMDGMTALPLLLEAQPGVTIIMVSTLTRKNAEISLKALSLGAKDYIPKPSTTSELTSAQSFREELLGKIKALAGARRSPRQVMPGMRATERTSEPVTATTPGGAPSGDSKPWRIARTGPITLRSPGIEFPEVLAIGSSTGGPQALMSVLGALPASFRLPILITQHMPATFTTILAEHITRSANRPCSEAKDGDVIQSGQIYVAPGDYHMVVEAQGVQRVLRLLKTPPENFCRPSVDPMLRSMVQVYGRRILCTILTGMGHDGMRGAEQVVAAGGTVIAQDEASSVVWGMPGAVANAGLCSAVLPLTELPGQILKLASRSAA